VFAAMGAALYFTVDSFKRMVRAWNIVQRSQGAFERVEQIMSAKDALEGTSGSLKLERAKGLVEFRNVCFAYNAEPTIEDIDVRIEPGCVCGLVGPSGAGKSTFVKMLPRFYDVNSGAVLLDGHDLRLEQLLALIGLFDVVEVVNGGFSQRSARLLERLLAARRRENERRRSPAHEAGAGLPAALALELAHAFILIHDDLIDGSDIRRGADSLPRRLDEAMGGSRGGNFRGRDVALVAGDVLYSLAMESLTQAEAPPEQLLSASREFMRAALDTGRGALLEIRAARTPPGQLALDGVEEMYALKTGAYTFRLPVRLAAVFAGAGEGISLESFSRPAGIAFQLSNDRQGLRDWLAGGPLPDDLRDGRPIWAAVWAWHRADAATRRLFVTPFGPAFRDWFRTCGAMEALDRAIQTHVDAALTGLQDSSLRAELASAMPS